ncbi:MAG: hypothetical protein QXY40_07230 [Candidatus Methanomethylicia archaeon]
MSIVFCLSYLVIAFYNVLSIISLTLYFLTYSYFIHTICESSRSRLIVELIGPGIAEAYD